MNKIKHFREIYAKCKHATDTIDRGNRPLFEEIYRKYGNTDITDRSDNRRLFRQILEKCEEGKNQ